MHPRGAGQMRHETIAIAMNPRCHLMMIIEKNKQNPSSHSRYQLCFLFSYHILSKFDSSKSQCKRQVGIRGSQLREISQVVQSNVLYKIHQL